VRPLRHAYFGGSFDPPHVGHHEIVLRLLDDPWTDVVHLVPTGLNPLKAAPADESRRRAWIDAWVAELARVRPGANIKLRLETLEIERAGEGRPNYTVDTMAELQGREPGVWTLVMGTDLLPQLPRWKEPERLFSLVEGLCVFPRGGERDAAAALALLPSALRGWGVVRWMAGEVPTVSSTELRSALSAELVAPGARSLL
jgi:nicotinate-nucleotide adenylyltransferase